MKLPSFSVVAMVREAPDVLERFVRHYRALGAEQVRLFIDGEAHEATLDAPAGCELVICDSTWWEARLGREPRFLDEALRVVFNEAHESANSDWQFFCDADEFLISDVPVAEMLAKAPPDCESVRIMNVEAVWGPGDDTGAAFSCTYFRMILSYRKQKLMRILLPGRRWELFGMQGFTGHPFGKYFLRRGTQVDNDEATFTTHRSTRNGAVIGIWADSLGFDLRQVFLAHFDAISEARWTEKWRRRLSNERPSPEKGKREAQAAAIQAAAAKGKMHDVFRELYVLSHYDAAVLRAARVLIRRRIFPGDH